MPDLDGHVNDFPRFKQRPPYTEMSVEEALAGVVDALAYAAPDRNVHLTLNMEEAFRDAVEVLARSLPSRLTFEDRQNPKKVLGEWIMAREGVAA